MNIRLYEPEDLARLKVLHEKQGHAYPFPDLDSALFPVGIVGEDKGEVQAGAFLRVTAEGYLLMDTEHGSAKEKYFMLRTIHEALRQKATQTGFKEIQTFVAPGVKGNWSKHLMRLGWTEDPWVHLQLNL